MYFARVGVPPTGAAAVMGAAAVGAGVLSGVLIHCDIGPSGVFAAAAFIAHWQWSDGQQLDLSRTPGLSRFRSRSGQRTCVQRVGLPPPELQLAAGGGRGRRAGGSRRHHRCHRRRLTRRCARRRLLEATDREAAVGSRSRLNIETGMPCARCGTLTGGGRTPHSSWARAATIFSFAVTTGK